ncbi:hypothetical protein [Evansella cellulosilytica]|uniref:Uncharacterized protein n=1 Tax=Evansella cellulosilytica (strain ATCC 21833 / DSM 2522 / FERM P-1141 / JCM 9156 / N-4) TaxID=649639 RepID=E6U1I8_EVAC2|nr:hypothetical protein [Evansella cellulosilytica]ADU30351.1 hypothetical protein Bcell_2090 [Evansella cellulosilytica DSM 2522]
MFTTKRTLPEKILSWFLLIMILCLYVAVPCGIAFLIGLIPGVAINYFIPMGIGVFIFVLHLLILVLGYMRTKKMQEQFVKGIDDLWNN